MTTTAAKWAERVAAWRQSGRTARDFCRDKEFSEGGLRYWASRLGREAVSTAETAVDGASSSMRLVRVVSAGGDSEAVETPILIELGAVRVSLRRGFDREALGAVLDVLAERGSR